MNRVYFTDRGLGKRFPEILAAAGLNVGRHHDLFPADGSDEQWLQHSKIEALLDAQKPPYIAKVYRPAAAELVRDSEKLSAHSEICAAMLEIKFLLQSPWLNTHTLKKAA